MSKKHIRKNIIDHLIKLRKEEIETLKATHQMYSDSLDLDEDSSLEVDDLVQQSRSTEDAIAIQLRIEEAQQELEVFINLEPELVPGITEGNVVITDQINMVIGLAFQQFKIDGEKFVGMSTQAPLYEFLEGKLEGDKIEFNGTEYIIQEIF